MSSQLSLYLCTWNVSDVSPPENLDSLLALDLQKGTSADIYAIGIQELANAPKDMLRDAFFDDPWTVQLTDIFSAKGYVRIDSMRLLGIHIAVFIRQPLLRYVHGVESTFTRTGFGGYWGNKGATTVRFDINGVSICIVNCHLTAHLPNVAQRIRDYGTIIESQSFNHPDTKTILDHDYVFWIGDLNFRLDEVPHAEVLKRVKSGDIEYLKQFDQLSKLMRDEVILLNFEEGPIKFTPTYKFDIGTDTYDTSKKNRKPGWCDRILWQVHENSIDNVPLAVNQKHYNSHMGYRDSDHKAVTASFTIKVSPRLQDPPVVFDKVTAWENNSDGIFSYFVATELPLNKWDWIGMYKADFKHFRDYLTWVWAPVSSAVFLPGKGAHFGVIVNKNYLVGQSGLYILGYYSESRKAMMGFSNTFEIESS